MANGLSIVLAGLVIGGCILAGGAVPDVTKEYYLQQNRAACWDKGVTDGLDDLAAQEALPALKDAYPSSMSQQDQDAVSASFSVTLSSYTFTGASDSWGTVNCEANISYSYTRPDKTKYTDNDGNIISYIVHYGQDGWQSEMNNQSIPSDIVTYKDAP